MECKKKKRLNCIFNLALSTECIHVTVFNAKVKDLFDFLFYRIKPQFFDKIYWVSGDKRF